MPTRVLQVAGGLPRWGGTEKYVLNISSALANRGYAVTIACPDDSVLAHRADVLGLPRIVFELRSAWDWKQLPGFMRALAAGYDVVHTHSPLDYLVPAVAARICRVPTVVMTRHMPHPFASRQRAYICAPLLYDRIIAVSGFIRAVLVQSGARPERVDVVPNGIAPVEQGSNVGLRLREELGIPRDALLIAAAGRMSSGKGFDVLIHAVHRLKLSGVTTYCVIFGAGTALDSLRSLSTDLQVDSHVRLPGFRDDVHDLWHTADIAVIPSVEPESFSYVAVEALSAGCAVVASRIGALPEVLSGESAIFTKAGDAEGIAAGIRELSSSPQLLKRMQNAARHRATRFTLDSSVTGLERVYAEISSSRNRRLT